jgi:ParB family transcriptional regulator, chromosome partitioning protein
MAHSALGRGLGALIPTAPPSATSDDAVDLRDSMPESPPLAAVPGLELIDIGVTEISANPRQPREVFDQEGLAELAHSLATVGFLQPVVVRPNGVGFELVAGERRWRAAQRAGLDRIPALVRHTADEDLLRDALLENLHRVQLNPLEEAAAYQQLLEDFGCTQDELANRLGRSRPALSNSLRLLRLPAPVQRRVAAGVLSAGHARALAGLADPEQAEAFATRVVAEGWSVRALEEAIALGDAPTKQVRRRSRTQSVYQSVADDLADRLDTRVTVTGSKRGRLSIDFASAEDLQRILAALRAPHTWN